jgi:CheY-like chemotaxis protein
MPAVTRPRRVLLIEDHPADIALTRKAFGQIKTLTEFQSVLDGVEAMQYLRQQGRFTNVSRPDLILLDLNMPRKNGREVLTEIKVDNSLKSIPVIVLTTSSSTDDIEDSYRLGANAYIVKPVAYADFMSIIKTIEAFWFQTAAL